MREELNALIDDRQQEAGRWRRSDSIALYLGYGALFISYIAAFTVHLR